MLSSLNWPVRLRLPTENPASSTASFNASIFTTASCLNDIAKEEFLISDFTDSTNDTFCRALFTALLHMAQVSPVACSVALLNCAFETKANDNTNMRNNNFFITRSFKITDESCELCVYCFAFFAGYFLPQRAQGVARNNQFKLLFRFFTAATATACSGLAFLFLATGHFTGCISRVLTRAASGLASTATATALLFTNRFAG